MGRAAEKCGLFKASHDERHRNGSPRGLLVRAHLGYAPKDKSKIIALRKLDAKAKLPATVFTYTFGIVSALVLGTGMSLAMQVIGSNVALGIIIGVVGMLGCGVNYPIYTKMLEKGKKKYAYEIMELAREISEGK